jgi:hypothetical protein
MDFIPKKGPAPSFSLDKRDIMHRRMMRGREWRAVIMLPVAIVAVAVMSQVTMHLAEEFATTGTHTVLQAEVRPPPMALPDITAATPMPAATAVAAQAAAATEMITHNEEPQADGINDLVIAWVNARLSADALNPPLPQRLGARELLLESIPTGTPMLISGRLEESGPAPLTDTAGQSLSATSADAAPGFQRLLLAMEDHQYVEVLAPPESADLVVGNNIDVVGRTVGWDHLPASGPTGSVHLPLVAARAAHPSAADLKDLGLAGELKGTGPQTIPDDLFTGVSDERTLLESRPYYYMLGEVRQELATPGVYANAMDGNIHADDLHQDPATYRNRPVTIVGTVYRSWIDWQVADDQPYGITRVVRILLYRSDWGPITETIDGKTEKKNKWVSRLFEFAVVTDQPQPVPGTEVRITGRFFKYRAIPVAPNVLRDRANGVDQRQSDNVYTCLAVAAGYTQVPPPPLFEPSPLGILLGIAFVLMGFGFWRLSRRDAAGSDKLQEQIKKLREQRRVLEAKQAAAAAAAPAPAATDAANPGAGAAPAPDANGLPPAGESAAPKLESLAEAPPPTATGTDAPVPPTPPSDPPASA